MEDHSKQAARLGKKKPKKGDDYGYSTATERYEGRPYFRHTRIEECCDKDEVDGHLTLNLDKVKRFGEKCKDAWQKRCVKSLLEDLAAATPVDEVLPGATYTCRRLKEKLKILGKNFIIHHMMPRPRSFQQRLQRRLFGSNKAPNLVIFFGNDENTPERETAKAKHMLVHCWMNRIWPHLLHPNNEFGTLEQAYNGERSMERFKKTRSRKLKDFHRKEAEEIERQYFSIHKKDIQETLREKARENTRKYRGKKRKSV